MTTLNDTTLTESACEATANDPTEWAHRPLFRVIVRIDHEPYWSSYLYCGLFELAARGWITVRFVPRFALHPKEVFCTVLEATDAVTQQRRTIAIDWRDNADLLALEKLSECDVYYKRNLIPAVTEPVCPSAHRAKLRPAGLSFAIRGKQARPWWVQMMSALWRDEQPLIQRSLKATIRGLHKSLRVPAMLRSLAEKHELECNTMRRARNVVFYQLQAYDPRGSRLAEDTNAINEERAQIIRALRRRFADRFVGGFIPTPYARMRYPDCLSRENHSRADYIRLMTSCRICLYTRGLRDSPAYKLGEYLAASRCIVSQRLQTVLPSPLRDGHEVLYGDDVEGLLEQCESLLSHEDRQERLSSNARRYYAREVEPSRRTLRFLQEAFA